MYKVIDLRRWILIGQAVDSACLAMLAHPELIEKELRPMEMLLSRAWNTALDQEVGKSRTRGACLLAGFSVFLRLLLATQQAPTDTKSFSDFEDPQWVDNFLKNLLKEKSDG